MSHPESPTVHVVDPVNQGHAWDVSPHVLLTIPATQVRLGDVVLDGCAQVGGIARADHRGGAAIRLDLDDLVNDSSDTGRLIVRAEQQLTVKRYYLADEEAEIEAAFVERHALADPPGIALRAFNVQPGMRVDVDANGPFGAVVVDVYRNSDKEQVTFTTRDHGRFDLDYNHRVRLTGVTLNPAELDDDDFGVD